MEQPDLKEHAFSEAQKLHDTAPVANVSSVTISLGGERARAAANDIVSAMRRLEVLARVPARIVAVRGETELLSSLASILGELFPNLACFALFMTDAATGALQPLGDARVGQDLLADLYAAIESMSAGERAALSSTAVIPFLQVAGRIPPAPKKLRGAMLAAPLIDAPAGESWTGMSSMGLLAIEGDPDADEFTTGDVEAVSAVAAQFSLALQRIRAERRAPMGRRMERDLELARQVQRTFLPPPPPRKSGMTVAAEYRPAYDIGGDFYDLVPSDEGPVMAVIGDVAGKGISAALLMSRVSSSFHRIAEGDRSPGSVLAELNNNMVDQPAGDVFVTAACLCIDTRARRITVANAGHVPPILRRKNGDVTPFGPPTGAPLGMLWAERYHDEQVAIEPGDIVFLMTDGLIEALDRPGDRLGLRALTALLASAPQDIGEINQRVLAAVDHANGGKPVDDVTLVAIEIV